MSGVGGGEKWCMFIIVCILPIWLDYCSFPPRNKEQEKGEKEEEKEEKEETDRRNRKGSKFK